eukprot:scaffold109667_cov27-Phaeocystis_antarctica.AAC.1
MFCDRRDGGVVRLARLVLRDVWSDAWTPSLVVVPGTGRGADIRHASWPTLEGGNFARNQKSNGRPCLEPYRSSHTLPTAAPPSVGDGKSLSIHHLPLGPPRPIPKGPPCGPLTLPSLPHSVPRGSRHSAMASLLKSCT